MIKDESYEPWLRDGVGSTHCRGDAATDTAIDFIVGTWCFIITAMTNMPWQETVAMATKTKKNQIENGTIFDRWWFEKCQRFSRGTAATLALTISFWSTLFSFITDTVQWLLVIPRLDHQSLLRRDVARASRSNRRSLASRQARRVPLRPPTRTNLNRLALPLLLVMTRKRPTKPRKGRNTRRNLLRSRETIVLRTPITVATSSVSSKHFVRRPMTLIYFWEWWRCWSSMCRMEHCMDGVSFQGKCMWGCDCRFGSGFHDSSTSSFVWLSWCTWHVQDLDSLAIMMKMNVCWEWSVGRRFG